MCHQKDGDGNKQESRDTIQSLLEIFKSSAEPFCTIHSLVHHPGNRHHWNAGRQAKDQGHNGTHTAGDTQRNHHAEIEDGAFWTEGKSQRHAQDERTQWAIPLDNPSAVMTVVSMMVMAMEGSVEHVQSQCNEHIGKNHLCL